MLLIGAGGTGKSEVLFKIKETLGAAVFVTATTGKAAALLQREKKQFALATQCIGGGQGIATILEAA